MMDALPNLHAALVHFPIVLLPLAVLVDLAGLAATRSKVLPGVALGMWGLAAASSVGTYYAGRAAADGLTHVPPVAQVALAEHADAAWILVGAVILLFVLRSVAVMGPRVHFTTRLIINLLGVGLLFQLVATADAGGALVYRHALAVSVPAQEPCPELIAGPTAGDPESRWTLKDDGSATWLPTAGDLSDSNAIVDIVGALEEVQDDGSLRIRSDGRSLVLLPETWAGVQVDASLTTTGFHGTVGIVHHVSSDASSLGSFTLRTDGNAELLSQKSGTAETLDQGRWSATESPSFSVSVAGSHLKGMVDGNTVTHGHAPEMPEGRVGILVHGVGDVTINRVDITPLESH